MEKLNIMDWTASILAMIGGIDMVLVGFFNYDLFAKLLGNSTLFRSVWAVVALAIVYLVGDVWVRVSGYQTLHGHA